jgi:Na+/melibiose symporter-like transporter
VGPLLAGVLLTATSLQMVLWVDAATFVVSAISLALIRTSFNAAGEARTERRSLRRDILEGLRYVLAQPLIRTMALFSLLANLSVAVFYPQIVFYAKEVLFASDAQVSQFFTAAGVGAVVFMLAADLLRKRLSYGVILLGSTVLEGVCVLAMIAVRLLWVDLVCFGIMFGLVGLYDVAFDTILQAITPNQLLGRVVTFTSVVAIFSVPLSTVVGGLVIDQVKNVLLVFGILGAFLFVLALLFVRSPLTRVERYLPTTQPAEVAQ